MPAVHDPVHAVAFVEFHVTVTPCPTVIVAGDTLTDTVGAAAAAVTVTVLLSLAVPLGPVHVIVKVVVATGVKVSLPLVGIATPAPHAFPSPVLGLSEPEHAVAFVEVQLAVVDWPDSIVADDNATVTTGAGADLVSRSAAQATSTIATIARRM